MHACQVMDTAVDRRESTRRSLRSDRLAVNKLHCGRPYYERSEQDRRNAKILFRFFFQFRLTFLLCIRVLPKHTLRKRSKTHKKRGVTPMIRFVSWLFDQHKHLNCQKYEQKRRRIGLQADHEKERSNRIEQQRYLILAPVPKRLTAVLQSKR